MGRKMIQSSGAPIKDSKSPKTRMRNGIAISRFLSNFLRMMARAAGIMPSSLIMPKVPPTTRVIKIMLAALVKPPE